MITLASPAVLGAAEDTAGLVALLRQAGATPAAHPLPGPDADHTPWADAPVVLVVCADRDAARVAYLGPTGVLATAGARQLVVDAGALDPGTVAEVADAARLAGTRFADLRGLADGLACWGGPADAWSGRETVLAALASDAPRVGEAGAASLAATVAAQVTLVNLAAAKEGLVLGARAGMDPEALTRVVARSSGASPSLTGVPAEPTLGAVRAPLTVDAARTRMEHALDTARRAGVPTPLAALVHGWLQSLARQGRGADPASALGDLLAGLAGTAAGKTHTTEAPTPASDSHARAIPPAARADAESTRGAVGFIGLGRIGRPMAGSILRAGHDLVVHNRSRAAVDELAALGAHPASSPREVAETCAVVVTCLPDNEALDRVYRGEDGLLSAVAEGQELIDCGTSSLALTRRLATAVVERGAVFADAPVSGGLEKAAAGELTIMVGGSATGLPRARAVLEAMADELFYLDEVGRGQIAKQVNNLCNATNFAALCEGMALAVASGMPVTTVYDLLSRPQLAAFAVGFRGARVLRGDYAATYTTVLRIKDSLAALELGQEFHVPVVLGSLVHELFQATAAMGWGQDDWTSLAKVYEHLVGVSLAAEPPPSTVSAPAHEQGVLR